MLDRVHKIAEIVAAIAIVVSLVFVGIQISQNTAAVYSQTHQSLVQGETHTSELLIIHPDVAALALAGEASREQLSEVDRKRFDELALRRFSIWEAVYISYVRGLTVEEDMAGWDDYYKQMLNRPGYKAYFNDARASFLPAFLAHAESILFP